MGFGMIKENCRDCILYEEKVLGKNLYQMQRRNSSSYEIIDYLYSRKTVKSIFRRQGLNKQATRSSLTLFHNLQLRRLLAN